MMWCLLFFQTSQGFLLDSCLPAAFSNLSSVGSVLTCTFVSSDGAHSSCFCAPGGPEIQGKGARSSPWNCVVSSPTITSHQVSKCLHLHVLVQAGVVTISCLLFSTFHLFLVICSPSPFGLLCSAFSLRSSVGSFHCCLSCACRDWTR